MSGIENARMGMGWVSANARPCCRNCEHVRVSDALRFSRPELLCCKGGFYTQPHAICYKHEPMLLTGSAPK